MTILRTTLNEGSIFPGRTNASRMAGLILVPILTVIVLLSWDQVEHLTAYGYPAVFLLSLIGNAAFLLPAPGIALVVAAGGVLDPIAVGLVAGLGAALGELTGYLVGFGGQTVLEKRSLYWRIEGWMRKSGSLVIFVLAAVPNPIFDIGGPESFTYHEAISLVSKVMGKEPKISYTPIWIAKVLAHIINRIKPGSFLQPDWIEILTMDSVADVKQIRQVFNIELETIQPYLQKHLAA